MLTNEHVKERLTKLSALTEMELIELRGQLSKNISVMEDDFSDKWYRVREVDPDEALLLLPQIKDTLEYIVFMQANRAEVRAELQRRYPPVRITQ